MSFNALNEKKDHEENTQLIVACQEGQLKKVKRLIRLGAYVNAQNKCGVTALMKALQNKDSKIVSELLKTPDIDVNIKDLSGKPALMYALSDCYLMNLDMFSQLLKTPGIDVNIKDDFGNTTLIHAVVTHNADAVSELLKVPGINVNAQNHTGMTALMFAVMEDKKTTSTLLNESKIDVNIKNYHGETALIVSAKHGITGMVSELLKAPNIDVNAQANNGDTALIVAARRGYTRIVSELLQMPDIAVSAKNKNEETAFMCAEREKHTECIQLIKSWPLFSTIISKQGNNLTKEEQEAIAKFTYDEKFLHSENGALQRRKIYQKLEYAKSLVLYKSLQTKLRPEEKEPDRKILHQKRFQEYMISQQSVHQR